MKKLIAAVAWLALCAGCASFSTTQIDERTNEQTGEKTKITTRAASHTFFDSKSSLAKWTAKQSESTQSAEVGGLSQSASSTNLTSALGHVEGIIKALRP